MKTVRIFDCNGNRIKKLFWCLGKLSSGKIYATTSDTKKTFYLKKTQKRVRFVNKNVRLITASSVRVFFKNLPLFI
jgi:hypothetical protein